MPRWVIARLAADLLAAGQLALVGVAVLIGTLLGQVWPALIALALALIAWHYSPCAQLLRG
jgi:hypothetical protein